MRWLAWLALGLMGCVLDPRPQALRRGLDQVRSVLSNPRLRNIASKSKQPKPFEERLVDLLFSESGRPFWPPREKYEVDFRYKDQARLPGRITYLRKPDLPWSVVVVADPKRHRILLQGYGATLEKPILNDEMVVEP